MDYFQYANTKLGGIQGHPVQLKTYDSKLDAATGVAGWNAMKDLGAPFIVAYMAVIMPVFWPLYAKDQIPSLSSGTTISNYFPTDPKTGYQFISNPILPATYDIYFQLMEARWKTMGKTTPAKFASASMNISTVAPMFAGMTKYECDKRGWTYVNVTSSPVATDVSSQVLTMKNFGADFVVINAAAGTSIAYVKEFDRQNYHPMVYGWAGFTGDALLALGQSAVGIQTYQSTPLWTDTDLPLVKLAFNLNTIYHPEVTSRSIDYMHGFTDGMMLVEALNRAQKTAGTATVTGPMMKAALETLDNWDPGMGSGYTYTPSDHRGLRSIRMYEFTGKKYLVPVTDWIKSPDFAANMNNDDYWINLAK